MYEYDYKGDDLSRAYSIIVNWFIGSPAIYRLSYSEDSGSMILMFYTKEDLLMFMNSTVSRYTCDTSGIIVKGLSLIINDSMTVNSIIYKSAKKFKDEHKGDIS